MSTKPIEGAIKFGDSTSEMQHCVISIGGGSAGVGLRIAVGERKQDTPVTIMVDRKEAIVLAREILSALIEA